MRWSHVAVIVTSLEQAEESIHLGVTDIIFAVSLVPHSKLLKDEPILYYQDIPVTKWVKRIKALGAYPHLQIRDHAANSQILLDCYKFICSLAGIGIIECWLSDLALLSELASHNTDIITRIDWRMPLTNSTSCQMVFKAGAQGICLAPPFNQYPAGRDTAYLIIQGSQLCDPYMNYQQELINTPLIVNDLEWLLFTYKQKKQDFISKENRELRELEGLWHLHICPFAHIENQLSEWRGWGCALCEVVTIEDGWMVLELPGSIKALKTAMQVLRLASSLSCPAEVRRMIEQYPEFHSYLCKNGARCKSNFKNLSEVK